MDQLEGAIVIANETTQLATGKYYVGPIWQKDGKRFVLHGNVRHDVRFRTEANCWQEVKTNDKPLTP